MFLDGKTALRIIDSATRFSAASFFDSNRETYGQTVDGEWMAFVMTSCTMYTGYPNKLPTDRESVFSSQRWKQLTDMVGVTLRLSGVKAHSSLGIEERLHEPLRRIYRKIKISHPNMSPKYILRVANKAMNDTIGDNRLVPSRLVFGILLRFPIINSELPDRKERLEAIKLVQAEMNSIVAERRVQMVLTKSTPPSADQTYKLREEVVIYSDLKKEWLFSFIVVDNTGG